MKKILIFIILCNLILTTFVVSASAEDIVIPKYVLLPDLEYSNIAYPVYNFESQSNESFRYIGLKEVYPNLIEEDNDFIIKFIGVPESVYQTVINIKMFTVENNEQRYVITIGVGADDYSYETVYSGYGYDLVIEGTSFEDSGEVNLNIIDESGNYVSAGYTNPTMPLILYTDFIQYYGDRYVMFGEQEENNAPTLPPYTMPDDPLQECLNGFQNLIVGIGAGTTDGYEVLFFKNGVLTKIGYGFLIVLGFVFACYILKIIFNIVRRKRND